MLSTSNPGSGETWAVVLAGGDGSRLHSLTTDHTGNSVPKQFCYLNGRSLLCHTLRRAEAVVHRGGWNDLGTPSRLARTLRMQAPPEPAPALTRPARGDYIDLAERLLGAFHNDASD